MLQKKKGRSPALVVLLCMAAVAMLATAANGEQARTTRQGSPPQLTSGDQSDWSSHNVDLYNSRYSPLDQINTSTVEHLTQKWMFSVGSDDNIGQVTPLVVGGVMYLHAPAMLFALNAATGESIWTLELDTAHPSPVRGPAYADGKIYMYNGSTLVAVDRETGELVDSFGDGGVLPIVGAALQSKYPDTYPPTLDPYTIGYRITTPPAYHDNTLYVGAALSEGHIPGGLVIATDATTGAIKWVFNTIPQRPQDDGWDIAQDSWGTGAKAGGGIWTQPAIDVELGMVYVNSGNPSPDYDGSARHGMNLFTNSTIALDMETGEMAWYYQTVHHDLWDWDNVTGPVLFDVTREGETIKGVSGLLLSSVRTKPRFNPSYERRRCAFVASWLSAAGASTGQGSAQRSAGGGVALTRAERGGIRRLGCRSPSTLILRGGTASDCRRIFGPSREHARLRATMVNARGDANRWYGPVWPAPVVGVSPRRSDRCAILSRGSPPGEITVQWSPRGYAAMRVSATKGRSSRHTRHTIRASRLAIAAVAMFAPRRAAIARAQVRNGVVF